MVHGPLVLVFPVHRRLEPSTIHGVENRTKWRSSVKVQANLVATEFRCDLAAAHVDAEGATSCVVGGNQSEINTGWKFSAHI